MIVPTITGTTINEAREALYAHFLTNWNELVMVLLEAWGLSLPVLTGEPLVPYALGDETMDPPNGLWVRLTVRHGPTSQETLGTCGNRNFERTGRVFVQGFMTPGGDERTLDLCMEAARGVFEGRTVQPFNIRFNAVEVSELGVIEAGRWQAALAEAPFDYTTRK
jgi:hypothetical protein